MELTQLNAISPIDGRYRRHTAPVAEYFSEFGLIKYRVLVEVEYFIALCELPLPQLANFDKKLYSELRGLYQNFSEEDGEMLASLYKEVLRISYKMWKLDFDIFGDLFGDWDWK